MFGNFSENGKMMLSNMLKQAFQLWTNVDVKIDDEVSNLVD